MELQDLFKAGKVTAYCLLQMRGRVDNLVFRRLKSGTYISRMPKKPSTRTEGQQRGVERFRKASEFAKKEMLDPQRKAYYKEIAARNPKITPNAYTAALRDYLNRPEPVVRNINSYVNSKTVKATKSHSRIIRSRVYLGRGPLRILRSVSGESVGIKKRMHPT